LGNKTNRKTENMFFGMRFGIYSLFANQKSLKIFVEQMEKKLHARVKWVVYRNVGVKV